MKNSYVDKMNHGVAMDDDEKLAWEDMDWVILLHFLNLFKKNLLNVLFSPFHCLSKINSSAIRYLVRLIYPLLICLDKYEIAKFWW